MKKLIILSTLFYFAACQKKVAGISETTALVRQAQAYFIDSVLPSGMAVNYRAMQPKTVRWDLAQVIPVLSGKGVLVPIVYTAPMLVKANFTGQNYFHLNYLTQLLVYKQPNSSYKAEVITSFPDSNYFKNPLGAFTGIKFVEDWDGNSIAKYLYSADGTIKEYAPFTKQAAGLTSSEICYTITGYNYSPDDPEDSYSWTEDGGCEANYASIGPPSGGGSYSNPISGITTSAAMIILPSGNSVIQSVSNYFQCFTNVGGTDHTYKVTLCIDEPEPGTRTPWAPTPGGLNGSSHAGNVVNAGHTFLILTETYGSTTITRNIGFYPSTIVYPSSPASPGQFNDDDNHSFNLSGTFTLTNAQFFDILNFITAANNSSYLYNLNSNNCTTFAINSMAQAGINLPRTIGTWPGGTGDDPGDLGEDMRAGKIPNMSLNTAPAINHPNNGQCN